MKQALEKYVRQSEQYRRVQRIGNRINTPRELYNEVIGAYSTPFGVAWSCLHRVRMEYKEIAVAAHGSEKLYGDDEIILFARLYLGRLKDVRKAIWEIVDNAIRGKSEEDSRLICCRLAVDEMRKLKRFSRMVNGDCDILKIPRPNGSPTYDTWDINTLQRLAATWSAEELKKRLNIDVSKIKEYEVLISKDEMAWLSGDMDYDCKREWTPMKRCWCEYYHTFTLIGCFWAAKLLKHGIDMRELEKEPGGCIINKVSIPDLYYCDRLADDLRGDCCVYDIIEAKELLSKKQIEQHNKDKRQILVATNTVVCHLTKSGKPKIDILKLYRFIDLHFAGELRHKYQWYALRRFLDSCGLLQENCDNGKFSQQMNHVEWFGHLYEKLRCAANEMNTYNFLNELAPAMWTTAWREKCPTGSRATASAVDHLYRMYANLELYKGELTGS